MYTFGLQGRQTLIKKENPRRKQVKEIGQETKQEDIVGLPKVTNEPAKAAQLLGKIRKKKRNKAVKFHFTIDCSDISHVDLPVLVSIEFVR